MEWNKLAIKMIVWTLFVYLGLTVCFFTVRNSVFLQCMFTIDEISQVDTIIRMHGEIYPDFIFFKCLTIMFHRQQKCKENWSGRKKIFNQKKLQPKKKRKRNNSKMLICINLQSRHILTISRNMDTAGESMSINVLFSRPNCCIKY